MQFGNRSTFGIDCQIAALHPRGQALGKFVVHIAGRQFGVDEPDATMLGNSIDAIERRLFKQGQHRHPTLDAAPAVEIANAYLGEVYRGTAGAIAPFAWPDTVWAPDGDEAFDDGSHILQMDVGNAVRLIGFTNTGSALEAADVVELTLLPNAFYSVLRQCANWFRSQIR